MWKKVIFNNCATSVKDPHRKKAILMTISHHTQKSKLKLNLELNVKAKTLNHLKEFKYISS